MFLVGFVGFSIIVDDAYGLVIPLSSEELLEQSQAIFVGNITSINVLEFEKSSTYYTEEDGNEKQVIEKYTLSLDEYTVSVEEFVKNPQNLTTLTVRQPTTSVPGQTIPIGGFELGDRVLFYIQNLDDVNEYSLESFKIPKKCDANSVVLQPRLVGTDFSMLQNGIKKQDIFTANLPITFVFESDTRTLYGQNFDVEIFVSKQEDNTFSNRVFHEKISAGSNICDWIGIAKSEFTLDSGKYLLNGNISDDDSRFSFNNQFSVVLQSPLKQIKNGIALIDVTCSEGKVPSYKGDRMRVACVSEETQNELWTRGWATMRLIMPGDDISHALCNNYEGKWHPKYFGCRDITDFQCSLMGGEFVDNLSICYDGICPEKLYSLCVTNPNLDIQYPDETEEQYNNRCRTSDTVRGPGPGPVECQSDLIECVSECGNDDIWHLFDEHGIEIDQSTAKMIVEQNEN